MRELNLRWKELTAAERLRFAKLAAIEEIKVKQGEIAFNNFTKEVDFDAIQAMQEKRGHAKLNNQQRMTALKLAWSKMADE